MKEEKVVRFKLKEVPLEVPEDIFFKLMDRLVNNSVDSNIVSHVLQTTSHINKKWGHDSIPKAPEIRKFIISQPKGSHSVDTVSNHFLKIVVKKSVDSSLYHHLWREMSKARKRILKKQPNMQWIKTKRGFGSSVTFTLSPKKDVE